MTKSELINRLYLKGDLSQEDVSAITNTIIDTMQDALGRCERIEIRGFGSFSVHERKARTGRNPKTGDPVEVPAKYVAHFKPGKDLRERVNSRFNHEQ
ncbi:MAG: integration host factor subunit beta [Gammaproteobacteria bacterium]|jgi:integration host factor subunit beta|nr:integration host factor subunit beta [Gammaproteobacteria bacterium]MBT5370091.1 integration host factor subunit beta [Gammaproteobacteria bacterium]MBT5467832.1 integration host factor subunit beta [Candidatus Neomarinimicrobiota bacterium]MBT5747525.1 integration host factor subunit beta [Gammaproteobacteria bacterium]MBT7831632.1 integration host factor subunit beta [Candidatus Neomarinimicrobiota bacterium]